jgi:hypothetical protein
MITRLAAEVKLIATGTVVGPVEILAVAKRAPHRLLDGVPSTLRARNVFDFSVFERNQKHTDPHFEKVWSRLFR